MKLLTVFIAIAMLSACVKTVDLQEYNDKQIKIEQGNR